LVSGPSKQSARPWVVKLGGSLHDSPDLRRWLKVISESEAPVVIVPGGGPFADAVRQAQKRLKFSDAAAHHMALLAMEQYGRAIADMEPLVQTADTSRSIGGCLRRGHKPVWLPVRMVLGRADIPESWDVTSDSLALWLAQRLNARGLLLVKSARLPGASASAKGLTSRGIVDAAFPSMLAKKPCPCWCVKGGSHRHAAEAFRSGLVPRATRISTG
jgi:aspartokinase-like uncharacterized kinase